MSVGKNSICEEEMKHSLVVNVTAFLENCTVDFASCRRSHPRIPGAAPLLGRGGRYPAGPGTFDVEANNRGVYIV